MVISRTLNTREELTRYSNQNLIRIIIITAITTNSSKQDKQDIAMESLIGNCYVDTRPG